MALCNERSMLVFHAVVKVRRGRRGGGEEENYEERVAISLSQDVKIFCASEMRSWNQNKHGVPTFSLKETHLESRICG